MSNQTLKTTVETDPQSNVTDDDLTDRLLMSLVFDVSRLDDAVERVRVQIHTLARERGIETDVPGEK